MPNAAPRECDHAGCTANAISRSIYCANHQTSSAIAHREGTLFPKTRRGLRKQKYNSHWISCEDPAGVDAALARDNEDWDAIAAEVLGENKKPAEK